MGNSKWAIRNGQYEMGNTKWEGGADGRAEGTEGQYTIFLTCAFFGQNHQMTAFSVGTREKALVLRSLDKTCVRVFKTRIRMVSDVRIRGTQGYLLTKDLLAIESYINWTRNAGHNNITTRTRGSFNTFIDNTLDVNSPTATL